MDTRWGSLTEDQSEWVSLRGVVPLINKAREVSNTSCRRVVLAVQLFTYYLSLHDANTMSRKLNY